MKNGATRSEVLRRTRCWTCTGTIRAAAAAAAVAGVGDRGDVDDDSVPTT